MFSPWVIQGIFCESHWVSVLFLNWTETPTRWIVLKNHTLLRKLGTLRDFIVLSCIFERGKMHQIQFHHSSRCHVRKMPTIVEQILQFCHQKVFLWKAFLACWLLEEQDSPVCLELLIGQSRNLIKTFQLKVHKDSWWWREREEEFGIFTLCF